MLDKVPANAVPELYEQRLVRQEADVLDMIVCLALTLCLLPWLAWVYAFENAQPPAQHNAATP